MGFLDISERFLDGKTWTFTKLLDFKILEMDVFRLCNGEDDDGIDDDGIVRN